MEIIDMLNELLNVAVELSALFFEFSGLIVLVSTGIKSIIRYVRKNQHVKLTLCRGMALGLV